MRNRLIVGLRLTIPRWVTTVPVQVRPWAPKIRRLANMRLIPFLLQKIWFVMANDPDSAEECGGSGVFENGEMTG